MRRSILVVAMACAAVLTTAGPTFAIGHGGWDHIGTGATTTVPSLNGAVYALNTDDPGVLLVGGAFTSAGGKANTYGIAKWSGSAWSAIGTVPLTNGDVRAIAYDAGRIFVGGTFTNAGGNANADFLAMWNGTTWSPFCQSVGAPITATVQALQIVGNTLYIGGSFANGAGIAAADFLLACDLTTGAPSATVAADGDINSGIYALTADSNGVLYAGGAFINADGIPAADHVAAYDGTWHAMGSGAGPGGGAVDSIVRSLTSRNNLVFVGTDSVNVAGIPTADHVVEWNGSAWLGLGTNTAGTDGWFPASAFIYALATYHNFLIVAGSFQNANGTATADQVAYFDFAVWRPIGSNGAGDGPLNANATAISGFAGEIYAGGSFTTAGGDALASRIASYSLRQPDMRIEASTAGPWTGDNVYSTNGSGETQTIYVHRGSSKTFYVNVQNDGLEAATFAIHGTGSATGYSISYYSGTTSITTAVKAGTYQTSSLLPHSSFSIKVVVHLSTSSATAGSFFVRASSTSGTPSDVVKAYVKVY